MTNEELNRKIATARNHWFIMGGDSSTNKPHDWTGSEEANAILLEEMNTVHEGNGLAVSLHLEGSTVHVYVDRYIDYQKTRVASETGTDRKRAIAEAWLKWKEVKP